MESESPTCSGVGGSARITETELGFAGTAEGSAEPGTVDCTEDAAWVTEGACAGAEGAPERTSTATTPKNPTPDKHRESSNMDIKFPWDIKGAIDLRLRPMQQNCNQRLQHHFAAVARPRTINSATKVPYRL